MIETIKKKLKPYVFAWKYRNQRKALKNKQFTIISDNCWGGRIYQELGLPYQSPFIGLFIYSPDYVKLLANPKHYLSGEIPLVFVEESRYRSKDGITYPVALLEDIEIHFLHYADEAEARSKWNRRLARMNWDNLYFKMNDNDQATYQLLKDFQDLPYQAKVIFSSKNYTDLEDLVFFENRSEQGFVGEDLKIYHPYFDAVEWLNRGGDQV